MESLRLLLISTPVGPLGSGLGGGVELTLRNIATELVRRGHQITIVGTKGSTAWGIPLIEIPGKLQTSALTQGRDTPTIIPPYSVLANFWEYGRQVQEKYDLIVNFAYDWLPFYLTPFFTTPIAHLVSMSSLSEAMDEIIGRVAIQFPGTIGVHSQAQAATFSFANSCRCLANGIDLSLYEFCESPQPWLAWVGRIAPEKGLEDAVVACQLAKIPLKIMGVIQDEDYWQKIQQIQQNKIPDFSKKSGISKSGISTNPLIQYEGFLSTTDLQQRLRQCQGLLMTPHVVEAFGNVVIEALACGVPAIAYDRGGPSEIIEDGKTGWLVEPDSVSGLVEAIAKLDKIDRHACRHRAESEYSTTAMGDRVQMWFQDILAKSNYSDTL
ncbi:MAG TPA: UDP-glucose--tetrahydrobiopterin glucosyltransferase [Cyanobacteria bacterium UBA9226]|nr:UDP-glucose--tetrahydrobiopterin glucosyltransferase [Cyanobacteria bacterium UBA9226]